MAFFLLGAMGVNAAPNAKLKNLNAVSELKHQQDMLEKADIKYVDFCNYCMPSTSRKVNSGYGSRWGRKHKGLDVKVEVGDTIHAAFNGKVTVSKYNPGGYGYYVVLSHGHGLETLYGHLSKLLVKPGESVKAGDAIGLGGNTGRSSGAHLHFETRLNGEALNPTLLFDFRNQVFCYVNSHEDLHEDEPDTKEQDDHDDQLLPLGISSGTMLNLALKADALKELLRQSEVLAASAICSPRQRNNSIYTHYYNTYIIVKPEASSLPVGVNNRMTAVDERQYWSSSSRQYAHDSYYLG